MAAEMAIEAATANQRRRPLLKKVALTRPNGRQHRLAAVPFCERL
jgi:hypothetical protein